jgi:non-homologous end joining protein Ku
MVCPIHGEVGAVQIVSGYQVAPSHYVVINPAEAEKLRPDSDKAIGIDVFVPAG